MADVRLVPVDDDVLAALLDIAVADAAPDEVTPPLGEGWSDERRDWFRAYHQACRAGFAGARRECTWAVLLDGAPVGAVRLALVGGPGSGDEHVAETGIWLARSARGLGVSRAALAAVLEEGRALGIEEVVAETAATNVRAQATLRRLGFALDRRGNRIGASRAL